MLGFMVESIAIGVLFIAALVYLGVLVQKNFQVKDTGCAKGCGSCSQPTETRNKKATNNTIAGVQPQ
jgi:hypothetical protein